MKRVDFNTGWIRKIWGVPLPGEEVCLPQDESVRLPRSADCKSGAAGGFFPGRNVIYEKDLPVTQEMLKERIVLEFEGVMANAEVFADDVLVAKQPYGYITFHADLTPHLRAGTMHLKVVASNDALPNSRWYTGTGIYRPVHLLRAPRASILPWGLFVRTLPADGAWTLAVQTAVTPEAVGKELVIRLETLDGECLAQARQTIGAPCVETALTVSGVKPWSPDSPALYRCVAQVAQEERVLDEAQTRTGFRHAALDREKGLLLNGEAIKLRGGCVHHDNGFIGAASVRDAEYRKARLLRDNGFNAVRCAHNPPAPAFLDACDELGLVVMDEFTDMWNIGKNSYDYHQFFREWWQRDLTAMVLRDRNHPSILMWSIGNEIPERDGSGQGYAYSRQLSDLVRSLDDTRLVTAGLNNIGKRRLEMLEANLQTAQAGERDYFGELSEGFLAPLDVAGYNYLGNRYEQDLQTWPERFLCGTESVAKEAWPYWRKVQENPRVIGDFCWTALDYLGEAGIGHVWYRPEDGKGYFERYPWRYGNCGDIDLCGRKRPCSYYRDAVWGTLEAPWIAVQHPAHFHDDGDVSYWAWPERYHAWDYAGYEGKPVQVDVYSTAGRVTLRLDGETVGEAACREGIASFDLVYRPGVLEAVDDQGRRSTLATPGDARRLRIQAERGEQLTFLTAEIVDENGTLCVFDRREITVQVQGGTLLGLGSADPASEESFAADHARAWNGCIGAVIRLEDEAAQVTISAPGLEIQMAEGQKFQ